MPISIASLNSDAQQLESKWVVIEGWASVHEECCVKLYDTPDFQNAIDLGNRYVLDHVDFHPDKQGRRPSIEMDQKHVSVVGKVDLTCIHAWNSTAADTDRNSDKIVWASGFCHTSVSPALIHSEFRLAENPQ